MYLFSPKPTNVLFFIANQGYFGSLYGFIGRVVQKACRAWPTAKSSRAGLKIKGLALKAKVEKIGSHEREGPRADPLETAGGNEAP